MSAGGTHDQPPGPCPGDDRYQNVAAALDTIAADWLSAATTTAARLMGSKRAQMGTLCDDAQAGCSAAVLAPIEVVGSARPGELGRRFRRRAVVHLQRRRKLPSAKQDAQQSLGAGG